MGALHQARPPRAAGQLLGLSYQILSSQLSWEGMFVVAARRPTAQLAAGGPGDAEFLAQQHGRFMDI